MKATTLLSPYESGRAKWPGALLPQALFEQKVAALGVRPEDLATRAGDLYLAWACAEGDGCALTYFERTFLASTENYVVNLRLTSDALDELRQRMRIRLLVGDDARIGRYRGRGSLGAWLRTCALRIGVDLLATTGTLRRDLDALDALVEPDLNPELATLRNRYAGAFRAALERNLVALDPRDKTILRMYFIDQLNIDLIGQIYLVHRATVARWLVRIRKYVLSELLKELQIELSASSSECRSILDLMKDNLEVDLEHVLHQVDQRTRKGLEGAAGL